jgi:hypothetical protein
MYNLRLKLTEMTAIDRNDFAALCRRFDLSPKKRSSLIPRAWMYLLLSACVGWFVRHASL